MAPVPPVFPQAPQVNQSSESSTLLSTVAFEGLPEGVGDGDAVGAGVGEAPATGDPAVLDPAVVPQPEITNSSAIMVKAEKRFRQVRTVPPFAGSVGEGTVLSELSIWIRVETRDADYDWVPKESGHFPDRQLAC